MAGDKDITFETRRWAFASVAPYLRLPTYFLVGTVFLGIIPVVGASDYLLHILILCYIYAIASLSLRTIMISGQMPLGHAAFMGIGAYISGMLAIHLGLRPWATIPIAVIGTATVGIIICFPFARLRALYYSMGSLFFGVAVMNVVKAGGSWTGGYNGLAGIPRLFSDNKQTWYYVILALLVLSAVALYRFEFSRIGVCLKAMSQSHVVASSVGINEGAYRILAVAVGSLFVGMAGAFYAHYNGMVSTSSFELGATLTLVMSVLVGGANLFIGPILGALALYLLPEVFRQTGAYSPLIPAGLTLIVVYLYPRGIAGALGAVGKALRGKRLGRAKNWARDGRAA